MLDFGWHVSVGHAITSEMDGKVHGNTAGLLFG